MGEGSRGGRQGLARRAAPTGSVRLIVVTDETAHQLGDGARVQLLTVLSSEDVVARVHVRRTEPVPLLVLLPAVLAQQRNGLGVDGDGARSSALGSVSHSLAVDHIGRGRSSPHSRLDSRPPRAACSDRWSDLGRG